MSIIYEALKKVEQSNIEVSKPQYAVGKSQTKHKFKTYLLYILVVCVALFAVNIFFTFLTQPRIASKVDIKSPAVTPIVKEQAKQEQPKAAIPIQQNYVQPSAEHPASTTSPVKVTSSGMLVLNGIFFSQDEGYALVNNHIVKVGDTVDGALVKRIGVAEVELEADGSTVKLTTAQR